MSQRPSAIWSTCTYENLSALFIFGFANSYIVGNEDAGKSAGSRPAELSPTMIEKIEQHHFDLSGILITHTITSTTSTGCRQS
jgi:hypothetical protein